MHDLPIVFPTQCVSSSSVRAQLSQLLSYSNTKTRSQIHLIRNYNAHFSVYLNRTQKSFQYHAEQYSITLLKESPKTYLSVTTSHNPWNFERFESAIRHKKTRSGQRTRWFTQITHPPNTQPLRKSGMRIALCEEM